MIVVKKKKKTLLIAILAAVLVLLITAAVLINIFLVPEDDDDETKVPEIIEGLEGLYNNMAVAYPYIAESAIDYVEVDGAKTKYELIRISEGSGAGSFMLAYEDAYGEMQLYSPPVMEADPSFDYSDLFAIEQGDGLGVVPKLTYLCIAAGTPYFEERIVLPEGEAERATELERFGFASENKVTIRFTYLDESGNTKSHKLTIGDPMITGLGYYFMVDDRSYIYSVESNNYFDYAMADFSTFISPIITSAGLEMDNAFEPYLTTDFQQWVNTVYDDAEPEEVDGDGVDVVLDGSKVTVTAKLTELDKTSVTGYSDGVYKSVTFDLSELNTEAYERLAGQLVGKPLGTLPEELRFTFEDYTNALSLGTRYDYRITAIESVINGGAEYYTEGSSATPDGLVKVSYYVWANGVLMSEKAQHGVLDLTSNVIPEAARAALAASAVGTLSSPIEFAIDYNETNSVVKSMVITEIITALDSNGSFVKEITDGTRVIYRYCYEVDGVLVEDYYSGGLVIGESGASELEQKISDALKGRTQSSGLNIKIPLGHYEIMQGFSTYSVRSIDYFITSRNIVSFEFQQASDRDPYYGESLYKNTMTNEYSIYALNASACEAVVKILGGITDSSSTKSIGLIGSETVAIGLTPDVLKEYGLYAYTLYFELPRGITSIVKNDMTDEELAESLENLDDYTYYSTLGFTLYVSEEQKDGTRYIASDLYDIVAKVNSDDFEFLNYEFVDFYARRNIMMTDITNIKNITFDFMMSDIYGTYSNELIHEQLYALEEKLYAASSLTEAQLAQATPYDGIIVNVTPSGECVETEFSRFLQANGYTEGSLYEFFDKQVVELDTQGTSNFKELTELIFYTHYEGALKYDSDEEKAAAFANAPMVMKMTVSLGEWKSTGSYERYSTYDYVYEFYRISDRRIAVRIYRQSMLNGAIIDEVSDFYLSTFSFKKIVSGYMGILNKELIDNNIPYSE